MKKTNRLHNSPSGVRGLLNIQVLVMLAILFLPSLLHAQPGFDDEVNDVPIDGGLSLLVAAGVGYGAKKLREKRKN